MRKEIRRAFTSPLFFLSVVVFFVCLQGYAVPAHVAGVLTEPIEYRQNAMMLTLGGIFFGGVILLLPFCAPMAHAVSQVDDIRSSMLQWAVLRSSVRAFARGKIVSCFLAAAASAGIAFAAHTALWHLLALPYDPALYPEHEIGFWTESFFSQWSTIHHGLPIFAEIWVGLMFSAGIWAVVALAAAVWVPDKMLVMTIPACIYKFWSSRLFYHLFRVSLPSPDTLFNDAQTVPHILAALAGYAAVLAVSIALYYAGLKRRTCYA